VRAYQAVDARTGVVLADLTDLEPDGPLPLTLGRYESASAKLPLPAEVVKWLGKPEGRKPLQDLQDWRKATRPGAVVVVALEDDQPVWGGLVLQRTTDHTAVAQLALVTLEAYLDRRYVGDKTYTNTGQAAIVADLVDSFIKDGTLPGLPIRVAYPSPGTSRDRTYTADSDKTIYAVLSDLSGVQGGPQWTIGWERQHSPERITPVLHVADRVGSDVTAGLQPAAVFDLPGCVTEAQLVESYSTGDGANRVTATTGQGEDRLASTSDASDFEGRPMFEYRWSPSTSITDTSTLTAHAKRVLGILAPGSKVLTLTAAITAAPVYGDEWILGDTIGYDLLAPAWLDGLTGQAQTIGVQVGPDTITPILAVPDIGAA